MRSTGINPFLAALFLSLLCMGLVGLFVILPIVCIQWTWNLVAGPIDAVPLINVWQACLLYAAGATCLYLFGFIQIDIEAGESD